MYGFYIYHSINEGKDIPIKTVDNDIITYKKNNFIYNKFSKFSDDKLFSEDDEMIIGIDGVILNLKSWNEKKNNFSFFKKNILKKGINFINELKGEFSGFYFDKKTEELVFFLNKTATHQVFYFKNDDYLLVAPSISSIIDFKKNIGLKNRLNYLAMYDLLTFSSILKNKTMVENIFKLGGGSFLSLKNDKLKVEKYYDFNNIEIKYSNKRDIFSKLDDTFFGAIEMEYEKDKDYNYRHLATLSGGLDSRMNVMIAYERGYKNDLFCFSYKNYLDHTISEKIASDLNLKYSFHDLKNGNYLLNVDEMVEVNNGLQFFIGAAHYYEALKSMNVSEHGLIHTGQIGDGILGGFVTQNGKQGFLKKKISDMFMNKIDLKDEDFDEYRDEEIFQLYQRVFNFTNFGSFVTEHFKTYMVSPFFDIDFMEIALGIEPKLKRSENIYIEWIKNSHPEITKYTWERTRMKPNSILKTRLSKYTNFVCHKFYNSIGMEYKTSMNPLEFWWKTNEEIRLSYDEIFEKNINIFNRDLKLMQDLKTYYYSGKLYHKSIVNTLLYYINKYQIEV